MLTVVGIDSDTKRLAYCALDGGAVRAREAVGRDGLRQHEADAVCVALHGHEAGQS